MDASPRQAPRGAVLPLPPVRPSAGEPPGGARASRPSPAAVEAPPAVQRPPAAGPPGAARGLGRPAEPRAGRVPTAPAAADRTSPVGPQGAVRPPLVVGPREAVRPPLVVGPWGAARPPPAGGGRAAVGGLARLAGLPGAHEAGPWSAGSGLERTVAVRGRASVALTRGRVGSVRTRGPAVRPRGAGRATAESALATVDPTTPVTAGPARVGLGPAQALRPRAMAEDVGNGWTARAAGVPTGRRETAGVPPRPRRDVQDARLGPAVGPGRLPDRVARSAQALARRLGTGVPRAAEEGPGAPGGGLPRTASARRLGTGALSHTGTVGVRRLGIGTVRRVVRVSRQGGSLSRRRRMRRKSVRC